MSRQKWFGTNLKPLLDLLASKDGSVRINARESLISLGKPAVSSLSKALTKSSSNQVRWEAAKALGAIRSPRSIPSLVKALDDRDRDVAWLAAEALKEFGKVAWPTLFNALIKDGAKSALFRQGAHHVLCNQKEAGFEDLLPSLLKDLEANGLRESAMVTAREINKRIRKMQSWRGRP